MSYQARSIVVDGEGLAYVADPTAEQIVVFDQGGALADRFFVAFDDGTAATPMHLALAPGDVVRVGAVAAFAG